MKFLITAASIIALAATPALAQGNGNGNGNRNGPAAQAERGNQQDRGGGQGGSQRGNPGNGNPDRGNADRGGPPERTEARGNGNGNGSGNGNGNGNGNADRGGPALRIDTRGNGNGNRGNGNNGNNGNNNRGNGGIDISIGTRGGLIERVLYRETGLVDGCPPGLAAKRNGCLPPGQARQLDRRYDRYSRYAPSWWGLPYARGSYFYDEGFLLRYDGNRISGHIPLLGGALTIGNPWPRGYGYDRVPDYYSDYYGLGDSYRYADNVVYRLDPETAAITSIAALLTGDEIIVGRPMPRGYDAYNVPYSYRDRYYDRPGRMYRYSDGYVYEINPETMLVASAIELLL